MNLTEMTAAVRRDLHDEDSGNYRWTDGEIERHIGHAVRDLSAAVPLEQKAIVSSISGSRDISISSIANRVGIEAVEYPAGENPSRFRRFRVWEDTLTLLDTIVPDGSDVHIYYGKLHTLNASSSTIPAAHEDIVVTGACGYAAIEWAVYAVNRVNVGGTSTSAEILEWGREKLIRFRDDLKKIGRKNRIQVRTLYQPYYPPVSQSTDYGP